MHVLVDWNSAWMDLCRYVVAIATLPACTSKALESVQYFKLIIKLKPDFKVMEMSSYGVRRVAVVIVVNSWLSVVKDSKRLSTGRWEVDSLVRVDVGSVLLVNELANLLKDRIFTNGAGEMRNFDFLGSQSFLQQMSLIWDRHIVTVLVWDRIDKLTGSQGNSVQLFRVPTFGFG